MNTIEVKKNVREAYGKIASTGGSCCGGGASCCGAAPAVERSAAVGYSPGDMASAPEGANLGLGCGNPVALASLAPGETVVDLGAGAGFDCFLAADRVGPTGCVIGVDMTPEMVDKARENARKSGRTQVEFRLGEIEHLPVADASADAVISNCVINLAPDKKRVFSEVYRVLKPGGRMMVSDIVLSRPLPEALLRSVGAYVACVAGASLRENYLADIRGAGFVDVRVESEAPFPVDCLDTDPLLASLATDLGLTGEELALQAAEAVASIQVFARKP